MPGAYRLHIINVQRIGAAALLMLPLQVLQPDAAPRVRGAGFRDLLWTELTKSGSRNGLDFIPSGIPRLWGVQRDRRARARPCDGRLGYRKESLLPAAVPPSRAALKAGSEAVAEAMGAPTQMLRVADYIRDRHAAGGEGVPGAV